MQKNMQSITITFENCDYLTIPVEYIQAMTLEDITEGRSLHWSSENAVFCWKTCNYVLLVIKNDKGLDPCYSHFDQYEPEEKRRRYTERILKYDDIVSIDINYANQASEEYYVKWEGENECTNDRQSSVCRDNLVWILIADKSNTLEEILKNMKKG